MACWTWQIRRLGWQWQPRLIATASHIDRRAGRLDNAAISCEQISPGGQESPMKLLACFLCVFAGVLLPETAAVGQIPLPTGAKQIAHFRLAGPIEEAPSKLVLFLGPERPRGLRDLLERFKRARTDANVVAVVLELDQPRLGWAQVQELAEAVERLKAAGKEVYCFLEQATAGSYMVAAGASQINLAPSGTVVFAGLYAQAWYFKGLLDWLGLAADIEQVGDYKAAAEPLTRTQPSEPVKQQLDWLFNDLYEQMVQVLVKQRGLSKKQARAVIDQGWLLAEQAREARLVDTLRFRQDFYKQLKSRYGPGTEIVRNYGARKGPMPDLSSPWAIFKVFDEMIRVARRGAKPAIALVYIDGLITTGRSYDGLFGLKRIGSTTIRKALDEARQDQAIKAVVVRVDSPGGSALASDIIFNAARRCGKVKPLIVSIGNVGASGGYYVSAAGQTVLAEPASITGSIGVLGGKLIYQGLLSRIGISTYELKRGRHADLLSPSRPFTDAQRQILRSWLESIYQRFKRRVVEARGDRLNGDIDELAGGRIFTGRQAAEKGLVDRLGGLDAAIRLAAQRAGLVEYDIRVMPRPRTIFDLLREAIGLGEEGRLGSLATAARARPIEPLARLLAGRLGRTQIGAVGRILQRIELLDREHLLTVMPQEICWP
ncbi:MAG: signal peptide peptidase SppA [Phycisphaerae bacterium]